jgi:hypothetical protein
VADGMSMYVDPRSRFYEAFWSEFRDKALTNDNYKSVDIGFVAFC